MIDFANSLGIVAPYYNIIFVVIILFLFMKLFSVPNKKIYLLPWQLLFLAIIIYIIEEILTIFYYAGIFQIPRIFNAVFEFLIITIFTYALLMQQEYLKKARMEKKKGKNAK